MLSIIFGINDAVELDIAVDFLQDAGFVESISITVLKREGDIKVSFVICSNLVFAGIREVEGRFADRNSISDSDFITFEFICDVAQITFIHISSGELFVTRSKAKTHGCENSERENESEVVY